MTIIDDGHYQGTIIFIIPKNDYQPDKYVVTNTYYGSCSGCDTLQSICDDYDNNKQPNLQQIKDYMTLALHLLQKMRWLLDNEDNED